MATSTRVEALLFEAYRRNSMAYGTEREKPLRDRRLGLGTAAAYRPALEAGLMVFHDGLTPPRGCMGWLCLTEAGIAEMERYRAEFEAALDRLEATSAYTNSLASTYSMVGGLVAR